MITNENWLDFCCTFFGIGKDNYKWLKHVTDNWNTRTNATGCGCEWFRKCNEWLELNPEPEVKEAEVPTFAELTVPEYDGPEYQTFLMPTVVDDVVEIIDVELPKEIEGNK